MSEEESTIATPSMMEVMQAMFNNLNNNINNNNNSLRAEINNNNSKIDSKIDEMQALNAAARIEMFELIDQRSRRSTRASTRATSRAVSPKSLVAQVSAKLESGVQEPPVVETPRINSFGPDLTLTQVFRERCRRQLCRRKCYASTEGAQSLKSRQHPCIQGFI